MSDVNFASTYELTPRVVAAFARRELLTRYAGFVITLGLSLLWGIYCLRELQLRLLSGFLFGLVLAGALLLYWSYRSSIAAGCTHSGHPISIRLTTHGIGFSSVLGSSESPWQTIVAVEFKPEGLLLSRRDVQQTVYVPAHALSREAASFIRSSVEQAGGRVSGTPYVINPAPLENPRA